MTKHFHIRAPLVANPKSVHQFNSVTPESLGYPLFPLGYFLGVCRFGAQFPAHGGMYILLAQRVVFERHGCLTMIHLGSEDVVQPELTREDIPHNMYRLLRIFSVGESIKNI